MPARPLNKAQKIVVALIALLALNGATEFFLSSERSALAPYTATFIVAILVTSTGAFFSRPWGVIGLWLIMAGVVYLALFLRFGLGQARTVLLMMAFCSATFMLVLFPSFQALLSNSVPARVVVQVVGLLPLLFTTFMLHSGLSTSSSFDNFLRGYISEPRLLPIVIQETVAAIVTAAVVAMPIAWGYRRQWVWVACLSVFPTIWIFSRGLFEDNRMIVKLLDIYSWIILLLFVLALTQRAVVFFDRRRPIQQ